MLIPPLRLTSLGILSLMLTQCTTTHMQMDQSQLREILMDYTEDQIIDNVVRARNAMPIVHIDMVSVDAVVKTSLSASFSGGRSESSSGDRRVDRSSSLNANSSGSGQSSYLYRTASAAASVASSVYNPFNWSTSGARDNTIDVRMLPVMDEDAVYNAYEKFVSINGGDSVRDSLHFNVPDTKLPHPDDPDGVHVGKKWRGVYYWVPNKYKKEFFKLCISAGVKRDARNAARLREFERLGVAGEELRRKRLY